MANRASGWTERASGAFSGIRDRFSGSGKRADDHYDDAAYDDYGEYGYTDDYGEYAYDSAYEDDYSASAGPVSTRGSASGYPSNPRLVSMDEARSSVSGAASSAINRSASQREPSTGSSRTASSTGRVRSAGYDSLFASTAEAANSAAASSDASAAETAEIPMPSLPVFEPATSKRGMKVINPQQYGDAADVTAALKGGDAVVLSMLLTPADLSKRVLDFSFGAASALDARVDCLADRVFFISKGAGITDAERESLRSQGLIK